MLRLFLFLCLALLPAAALPQSSGFDVRIAPDRYDPARNAVATVGGCTGTLIAHNVVLTAAHCVPPALRAPKPDSAQIHPCTEMQQQAGIQKRSWEDPYQWYPSGGPNGAAIRLLFGHKTKGRRQERKATAYALPRCTDMALLRLDRSLPLYVARAVPVLSTPPANIDRTFALANLRHAGFGVPKFTGKPAETRATGSVGYWGYNKCHLIGLPPMRETGQRILPGDSCSPLLLEHDGREITVGVLWGSGLPDWTLCGEVLPRAPKEHGSYTPTFRGPIGGTEATDIGDWLRRMVPEAEHVTIDR